jgi:hypothetical protein
MILYGRKYVLAHFTGQQVPKVKKSLQKPVFDAFSAIIAVAAPPRGTPSDPSLPPFAEPQVGLKFAPPIRLARHWPLGKATVPWP